MFRETETNTQMSLFDNPADLMGKRAVKKYEDPKAWFNQFYELVTSQVDESVFKPLFKEGNMGAPTASIRQLVLDEQFIVEHGQVTPRDKKAIAADSVQNPDYRTAVSWTFDNLMTQLRFTLWDEAPWGQKPWVNPFDDLPF